MASFDAMSVSVKYVFQSDAQKVLGDIARYSDEAAVSLDKLSASVEKANAAVKAFEKSAGLVSAEIAKLDAAAEKASVSISSSLATIGTASEAAAARVNAATASMAAGFAGVATAARAAAASGGRVRSGTGVAGAAGAASAMGAGSSLAVPHVPGTGWNFVGAAPAIAARVVNAQVAAPAIALPSGNMVNVGSSRVAGVAGAAGAARMAAGGGGRHGGPNSPWFPNVGPIGGGGGFAIEGLQTKALHAAKGLVIGGIGIAGDALYEAGKLQQELSVIQIATGANAQQMERIRQSAYDLSNATAQSVAQSANVIGVMAKSGINDPRLLTPKFIDVVGKFADVQYLKSGGKVSFEQATTEAIQLAHQQQAYKPEDISKVLNTVQKLSFMMPDSLNRYLTQSGYYTPIFRRYGVAQDQGMVLGAWMDRMGLGRGKGGSGAANFLMNITNPNKKEMAAQKQLGIYNDNGVANPKIFGYDEKGNSRIDVFAAFDVMNERIKRDLVGLTGSARAKKERDDIGLFKQAVGVTGQRVALLADDKGIEQLVGMRKQLGTMPDVNTAQASLMKNMDSQAVRAWSNFQSLMTEIGTLAIPGVTKGLTDLGDALHDAQAWLHQNAAVERMVQKDIINGVKGVEQYIVLHRRDWIDFGHDIAYMYGEAKKLGPEIKTVADFAGSAYIAFKSLGDVLNTAQKAEQDLARDIQNNPLYKALTGTNGAPPDRMPGSGKGAPGGFDAPGDESNIRGWLQGHRGKLHGGGFDGPDDHSLGGPWDGRTAPKRTKTGRHVSPHQRGRVVAHPGDLSYVEPSPITVNTMNVNADSTATVESIVRKVEKTLRKGASPRATPTTPNLMPTYHLG